MDQNLPIKQTHFSESVVGCGCERRYFSTNVATRGILIRLESSKIVFRRGSAPHPTGGSYDALTNPLIGWGGDTPPFDAFGVSTLGTSNSTPSVSRVRRSPCASLKLFLPPCLLDSGADAASYPPFLEVGPLISS